MIGTEDLVEFVKKVEFSPISERFEDLRPGAEEYKAEIVARLRAYDKLLEMPRNRAIVKRLTE